MELKYQRATGVAFIFLAFILATADAQDVWAAPQKHEEQSSLLAGHQLSLGVNTNTVTIAGDPGTTISIAGALVTTSTTNRPRGYILTLQANAANLTSMTSADVIPIANLATKSSAAGTFTPVSTTAQTILTTTTANGHAATDATVTLWDFRLTIPWIAPGTYSVSLVYTLVNNP